MGKRLIWIGAVLLSGILYLFENNPGTLTVLVGVLVVPILGFLPLLGKGIRVEMDMQSTQEKGVCVQGALTVTNLSILPKPRLGINVSCRNYHTGETVESRLELSLLPKQSRQVPFTFVCSHCGKVEIAVSDVKYRDIFGLFGRGISCRERKSFTVLPWLFQPDISLEHSDTVMPDSDIYSQVSPGSDPGETFAVREYIPGDAIRKIHWKLSEKTGKTMVREFGMPVVNEVAILLENAGSGFFEEADAITEVFASVSSALASRNIRHHVFWRDDETHGLRQLSVDSQEDFSFMLEELLELPAGGDGSVVGRFLEYYPHCPYSHVMIVGRQIPAGVRDLYNGNRVSILIPESNGVAEGLQADGTHVLSFGIHSYSQNLCRMEV